MKRLVAFLLLPLVCAPARCTLTTGYHTIDGFFAGEEGEEIDTGLR